MSVAFEHVSKRFPGVLALERRHASRSPPARVTRLCGENGAGKSTLGKILAGIHRPDAGQVIVEGRASDFSGPQAALQAGIGMVHQELAFCENLSVAENLCLGSLPAHGGRSYRGGRWRGGPRRCWPRPARRSTSGA